MNFQRYYHITIQFLTDLNNDQVNNKYKRYNVSIFYTNTWNQSMSHQIIDITKPYQYFCNDSFFNLGYPVNIYIDQDNQDRKYLTTLHPPNNISNLNLSFKYPLDNIGYLEINNNQMLNSNDKRGNLHRKEPCNNKTSTKMIVVQDPNFTDNHLIMGGILGLAAILIIIMSIAKYRHNTAFDEEYNF